MPTPTEVQAIAFSEDQVAIVMHDSNNGPTESWTSGAASHTGNLQADKQRAEADLIGHFNYLDFEAAAGRRPAVVGRRPRPNSALAARPEWGPRVFEII
jgi:hypothetical protein